MKRFFGATLVGTFAFAAVFASASLLPVTGGTIQAGGLIGLACQTNPITVGYTTQIEGDGLDHVTGVVLSGIDPACYGKWADVSLMPMPPFPGGVPWIASGWGVLDSDSSTTFDVPNGPGPNRLASEIYDVQVAIRDQ